MKVVKLQNRVLITVTKKGAATLDLPIMNKVLVNLLQDTTDLNALIEELGGIKQWVNREVNIMGFALRDVDIKIEFIQQEK